MPPIPPPERWQRTTDGLYRYIGPSAAIPELARLWRGDPTGYDPVAVGTSAARASLYDAQAVALGIYGT